MEPPSFFLVVFYSSQINLHVYGVLTLIMLRILNEGQCITCYDYKRAINIWLLIFEY